MPRFVSPKPLPTPYERELLTVLMEECAEVQQRASKLIRFGRDEVQPGQALTNKTRLSHELGDLTAVVRMAEEVGLVDPTTIDAQVVIKKEKLAWFMQTQLGE